MGAQPASPDGSGRGEGRKATPPFLYTKGRQLRYSDKDNFLGLWIPKSKRRRGYVDNRLRRRTGPLCPICSVKTKRYHWPWQGCWTGPKNKKRDLKEWREETQRRKLMMRAMLEKQDKLALLNAKQPEVQGTPKREGARIIRPRR